MYRCQVTGKLSRHGNPRVGELTYIDENKSDAEDSWIAITNG